MNQTSQYPALSKCMVLEQNSVDIILNENETNQTRTHHCKLLRKACPSMFMPDVIKIPKGSILTHTVSHDCLHKSGYPSFPYAWFQLFRSEEDVENADYWGGDSVTYVYKLVKDLPYVICQNSQSNFTKWLKGIIERKELNPDRYARDYSLSAFITQILGMPYVICPDNMNVFSTPYATEDVVMINGKIMDYSEYDQYLRESEPPNGWRRQEDENGMHYFINESTGKAQRSSPLEDLPEMNWVTLPKQQRQKRTSSIVLPCYGNLREFLEIVRIENKESKDICDFSRFKLLPVGDGASSEKISKPNYFLPDLEQETSSLISRVSAWPVFKNIRQKYKDIGLT